MKSREAAILFALAALQFISLVDFMIVMPLGPQRHFGTVGILAAGLTLASLWLAPRIRPA